MQPKVGIVVVSYNASAAVRVTLASLRQSKNNTPYKLLLIDNASSKEELSYIQAAFKKHISQEKLPWQFISLGKNRGFAGGNNYGVEKFLKDPEITHICMLNSDVIVGDYWLDRLLEKKCDIVSAVTNKADSEQCVPIDYSIELADCLDKEAEAVPAMAFDAVNSFSQKWHESWKGNLVQTDVTFFCVLLSRELIIKVGLLDKKFFPGGYEDDDYCLRVNKQGIKIFLARDVFIHHFGSASFGQLQQRYFNEKASKNRKYLEDKHAIICKRRPERPVTSYTQDIAYAFGNRGNKLLQAYYSGLYVEMLTRLISHYENEFKAIHAHLLVCGHTVNKQLQDLANEAVTLGDLAVQWGEVVEFVTNSFKNHPSDRKSNELIIQKLEGLSHGVYIKAECNRMMHEFLCSKKVFSSGPDPEVKKTAFQKIKWLATKGLPFIWRLKGIVFFGGYPYVEREKDGYFQRIRSIDSCFTDRWRIYVDHMKVSGKTSWYDRPAPQVLVLHVENHRYRWFMKLIVRLCILKCRTIYFHSVLRMHDSNFGSLMRWPGVTKCIDIHGVVPEEFRYHNDFFSASMYDAHERLAVRKADYVLVVSNSMHGYLKQKYREAVEGQVIVLPIFPDVASYKLDKPYINDLPVIVYAGGTHKWQQVPKMIDAIARTKDFCHHKFYCPNPAEVMEMMPAGLDHHPHVTIGSKSFNELLNEYKKCHYGFILREDIIVNHAACPTKLVEYIAMGIVPVVDTEKMGDFRELGMKFITLKDLMEGNLPSEDLRNEMARINFSVYEKLQQVNQAGKSSLQQALRYNGGQTDFLGTTENSEEIISHIQESEINPFSSLPACDVLVQVDNFLVGGLENVVLDLNETLIRSGLKVNLLILGEAGLAAQRAKEKDMNVIIAGYTAHSYHQLLQATTPAIVISHYSTHGAEICGKLRIPLLQVIHNTYMWFSNAQVEDFARTARFTTAFIAVSDFVKEYSLARLGLPKEKCLVIPNGIDIAPFRNMNSLAERQRIRKELNILDSDFVFLTVGSITHQKNHISTVRAFHTALKYCGHARLVILGKLYEPQLWDEIQEYITAHELAPYIIYAGESKNPQAYYSMADAFVHSAFFEGGQLSLLEAIVANLPIVTTEIGFAMHFKKCQGVNLVPPPIEIINYKGHIWQLTPTAECERRLAIQILTVYKERTRPDIPEPVIQKMDKIHTYELYVEIITNLVKTGELPERVGVSWPDIISEKKKNASLAATY